MLIEVPLFYSSQAVRKRERNARDIALREFVEVDVRDVSADEAPVACEVVLPGAEADGVALPGRTEPILSHGGSWWMKNAGEGAPSARFWAKFGLMGPKDRIPPLREEFLGQFGMFDFRNTGIHELDNIAQRCTLSLDQYELRMVTKDRRQSKLDDLLALVASDHLAVDGEIYVKVDEPYYALGLYDDPKGTAVASVTFGLPPHEGRDNRTFHYPMHMASEFEAAIAFYEEDTGRAVVRDAGLIPRGGFGTHPVREAEDLYHAANGLLSRTRFDLPDGTKEQGAAWFDLRDTFRQAAKKITWNQVEILPGHLDPLVASIEAFSTEWKSKVPHFVKAAAMAWTYREIPVVIEAESSPSL